MSDAHQSHPAFAPDADEPAVRSAALAIFVDAARAAPVHEPKVSYEDIKAAVDARVLRRRAGIGLGVVGTAAAILLALNLSGRGGTDETAAPAIVAEREAATAPAIDTEPSDAQTPAVVSDDEVNDEVALLALAEDIEIVRGEGSPNAEILGSRAAVLARGSYALSVEAGASQPLEVTFTDAVGEPRVLVLREGQLEVDTTGDTVVTRLETGVAAWRSEDGAEVRIEVSGGEVAVAPTRPEPAPARPSASDLARRAETELAAGDRGAAIKTLRTLVRTHRRSAEARTGLLDLARLLKASGDVDGSRCAYELYLQRWPVGALSSDVERSLAKLGDGPACKGLRPIQD